MNEIGTIDYKLYGIGKRHSSVRFDDLKITHADQRAVFDKVKIYADNLVENYKAGRGLVMLGNVDTGKTQLASLIIKKAVDMQNGYSRLTTEIDLLDDIARADNFANHITQKEIVQKWVDYKFLAIDDIGVEGLTDKQRARLYAVINGRYAEGRPTIVSSNLDRKNLEKHLGKRNYSRLTSRTASDVLIFGWKEHSEVQS